MATAGICATPGNIRRYRRSPDAAALRCSDARAVPHPWVDPAVMAAGLPGLAGVIVQFIPLNPDPGFGKQVDATEVIPVGMANHDVRDSSGCSPREFDGFVGANVVTVWKCLRKVSR